MEMKTKIVNDNNSITCVVYYTGFNKYKLDDMFFQLVDMKLKEMLEMGYTLEYLLDVDNPGTQDLIHDLRNAVCQGFDGEYYIPFVNLPLDYIHGCFDFLKRQLGINC